MTPDTCVVLAETYVHWLRYFQPCTPMVWWLSIDNAFEYLSVNKINMNLLRSERVLHTYQSSYAHDVIRALGCLRTLPLSDYTPGKPVPVEEVRRGFGHVCERAQNIIRHGRDWHMWVLCDRDPVNDWIDGRVALLGDAAHPMLQYMAQGACMAMEDAVCLADSLSRHAGSLEAGLSNYRDRRVLRTARVQLTSRAMGDHVYHPAGPHAALRNAIMSGKSQTEWLDVLEWIYGGNGLD